jgi:hypothetical protein
MHAYQIYIKGHTQNGVWNTSILLFFRIYEQVMITISIQYMNKYEWYVGISKTVYQPWYNVFRLKLIRLTYQPWYNVFLSQQISQQYFLARLFSEDCYTFQFELIIF